MTGWIDTEYSLAGYLKAHDGTVLSYAFYAIGTASAHREAGHRHPCHGRISLREQPLELLT